MNIIGSDKNTIAINVNNILSNFDFLLIIIFSSSTIRYRQGVNIKIKLIMNVIIFTVSFFSSEL